MTLYSANLGFLWNELTLPDAIRAAKRAGFDAVECHFPYDYPPEDIASVLNETGLHMICINTFPGDMAAGEFGLSALPDRKHEARAAIDQAIAYAKEVKAGAVHVLAGKATGQDALDTFIENVRYAADAAADAGLWILIEPMNDRDMPGYLVSTLFQAVTVLKEAQRQNVKLLFDCYHVQITEGDLATKLQVLKEVLGHVQIASVPDRGEPGQGELNYPFLMQVLDMIGYKGFVGAEYKPRTNTDEGLGWLADFRAAV
ncbi:hydroxypyruvate isomerase [Roseibium hamelinense]|uniref:Hydroxypyruvate isomerase n=1 Tax=Roseibium hamelinense TaxID=150831 RepID=A0A562TBF7_9HYPH|nr:TIM barrel protein [Roseibium hamelinense]MTI45505.1 isomerase [Roseibium hamelinense]TWI90120.1 hydroxypyruvate isomerase [Roseibium hamelinense]